MSTLTVTLRSAGGATENRVFTVADPAPSGRPLVGFYNGGPSTDDAGTAVFGKPAMASTYYQWNQIGNIVAAETARIRKGISPLITITTKGGTTSLSQIAAGPTAWLDQYVAALATLAKVDPTVPVYATLDHEFEVKQNQAIAAGQPNLWPDEATYARAFNRFGTQLRAAAPTVKLLYWPGGYDKASVGAILAGITVPFDYLSFDPYSSDTHSASETFETTVNNFALTWLKANADYKRLGSPPIGLSECGSDTAHGDAAVAAWLTDLKGHATNLGLAFVVLFNRDATDYSYKIDGGSFPKSVAAFKASVLG